MPQSIEPLSILCGEGERVAAMCTAFTKSDGEVIVSVTTKGLLSLWSFENGQFLGQCDALASHNRTPHVCTAVTLGSQSHVAVAGGSSDVYIVDVEAKEVAACLCGKAGWVTGLHSSAVRLCGDSETPFAPMPSVLVTLCADESKAALWHIGEDGLPIEYPTDDTRCVSTQCVPPSRVATETSPLGDATTLVMQKSPDMNGGVRSVSPATTPPCSVSPAAGAGDEDADVEEREREFSVTPPVIGIHDDDDLLTTSCAPLSVVDLEREGDGTRVVTAVLSPESLALLLVVRAEAWELYSAQSGERLLACAHADSSGQRSELCGGGFGDENTVAVWSGDGVCRVYGYTQVGSQMRCKLCCTLCDVEGTLARFPCTEHYSDHHYVTCRCTPAERGALDLRLSIFRIPPILIFPVTRGQAEDGDADGSAGSSFTLSSSSKELHALYIDQLQAREDIERLANEGGTSTDTPTAADGQRLRARELTIHPFAVGRFSSGWGGKECEATPRNPVTASYVVEELMVLVCGHADGTLTWSVLPSLERQQTVCAHDGAVTCLKGYVDQHTDLPAVLLSGSVDMTVKVWKLMTFECLHVFSFHTGVVTSITRLPVPLLSPFLQEKVAPPRCTTADVSPFEKEFPAPCCPSRYDPYGMLRRSFVSVGTDNCVAVFSLDTLECQCWLSGHASPIDEIRWTHNDVLYVRCKGGETYFWDLYTNALLERGTTARVRPCVADSIQVYKSKATDTDGTSTEESGLRTCVIPIAETRGSVQVLSLDTRALCQLFSTQRAPLSSRRSFTAAAADVVQRQRPSRTSRFTDTRVVVVPNPAVTAASYLLPWRMDGGVDAALRKDGFFECVSAADTSSAPSSDKGSAESKPLSSESTVGESKTEKKRADNSKSGEDGRDETRGESKNISFSFGLMGVDGKRLTLFVPRAADGALSRFTRDKQTSALHALAMVGIADALTHSEGTLPSLSALRCFCATQLFADQRTVKPSLEFLTALWNDGNEELAATARELSYLSAARLSAEDVGEYVGRWTPRLLDPKYRYQATLILGAVGAERGEAVGVSEMELIAGSVYEYYITAAPAYIKQNMTEIIRRGIRNFKRYIDLSKLIESMFAAVAAGGSSTTLLAVASEEPQLFIASVGSKVAAREDLPACAALLGSIQGTYRSPFIPLLVSIAELSLKLIGVLGGDRATPTEQLLYTTLLDLPELYPMAAVDYAQNCCYVGGERGAVHCFDLKKGAKVAIFKGAEHQVDAVALSRDKRRLAVLCGSERTLKVWDTGAVAARLGTEQREPGFFRSLLKSRRVLERQQFVVITEPLRAIALDDVAGVSSLCGSWDDAEVSAKQARELLPELHWASDANDRVVISTKQGARVELTI